MVTTQTEGDRIRISFRHAGNITVSILDSKNEGHWRDLDPDEADEMAEQLHQAANDVRNTDMTPQDVKDLRNALRRVLWVFKGHMTSPGMLTVAEREALNKAYEVLGEHAPRGPEWRHATGTMDLTDRPNRQEFKGCFGP